MRVLLEQRMQSIQPRSPYMRIKPSENPVARAMAEEV
jgi:hypothetical protein